MFKASFDDKKRVVDILVNSFADNRSVNYIIPQDKRRKSRIRHLMAYSFDVCFLYGKVYLSDDKNACALILLPEKKKSFIKSTLLDIRLIFLSLGFSNILKAMKRESKIKALQPNGLIYYLWFIGVAPNNQGKGIGTRLLNEIIDEAHSDKRFICLETSTLGNIPWYQKLGFSVYNTLDFGYQLFFLKND